MNPKSEKLEILQTVPKFSDYAFTKADLDRPLHDNKLPLPMNTKKTVLRDLQNENTNSMLTCTESPAFLKENGPETKPVKVSSPKKSEPNQVPKQSQSTNANGHLVYVRRKPEAESPNTNKYVNRVNNSPCSPPRKVGDEHRATEEKLQSKEPPLSNPQIVPTLTCLPPGKPSAPSAFEKSPHSMDEIGSDSCALSLSITPTDHPKRMKIHHWEERYSQLQDFLEMLDQSNQENYVQKLRSLSSEDLSSQAVQLEKRSIQLSLEEAKELQRVQQLDILGKHAKNSRAPANE